MRTRSFRSSSNPMSSDGHRADEIDIRLYSIACRRQSGEKNIGHVPKTTASQSFGHVTVLLHEAIEQLGIQPGDVVVDATLGGGGHAKAITELLGKGGTLIGMDLDQDAVERTRTALKGFSKPMGLASAPVDGPRIHLVNANFRDLSSELARLGITHIDKALFDLGWSGFQIEAGRGFSFLKDEPLSMTYAKTPDSATLTAATIVNEWEEESIADIIFGWGEERYSRRIAKKIVESRVKAPIRTSLQLAEIIRRAVPPAYRHGRIHPATRTFQALRIAVNDELGALKEGLMSTWRSLREGGRIAVITFHSIEDREVKNLFISFEKSEGGKRVTKSPIRAGKEELAINPRARSAKLRVIEKVVSNQ